MKSGISTGVVLFTEQQDVHVASVVAFGKKLPVFVRGNGKFPLLVLGPASLFKKTNFIPEALNNYFTIYFVDFFSAPDGANAFDYTSLRLEHFVLEIENTRVQLQLKKMALFAHSAAGVLAVKYSLQFPKNIIFNIFMCSAPIWGSYKNELASTYFRYNANGDRHRLFSKDQLRLYEKALKNNGVETPFFIKSYNARRAYFYKEPQQERWRDLWNNVNLDEKLTNRYFELIQGFDIRATSYNAPTFLGLGLYDYSCPFYIWTDDVASMMRKIEYYIFSDSGHYPMLEEPKLFTDKIVSYMTNGGFQN